MITKQQILKEISGCCISDESANSAANKIISLLKLEKQIDNIILSAAKKRGVKDSNDYIISLFSKTARSIITSNISNKPKALSFAYSLILNLYPK